MILQFGNAFLNSATPALVFFVVQVKYGELLQLGQLLETLIGDFVTK